jgi:hypothetical protein
MDQRVLLQHPPGEPGVSSRLPADEHPLGHNRRRNLAPYSAEEGELLDKLRALRPRQQKAVRVLIDELYAEAAQGNPPQNPQTIRGI